MAERLIAPVLKTGGCKSSVGSNPTLSANTMINKISRRSILGILGSILFPVSGISNLGQIKVIHNTSISILNTTSPNPLVPWKIAHGLEKIPQQVIVSNKSAGLIWWTGVDKTYIYLMGSDSGLSAAVYVGYTTSSED